MTTSTPEKYPTRSPTTPVAGDFSLHYLLEIFFRRKRVFLLVLILTPMLAILISFLMKNEYMSSTTILLGKDEILNPLVRYETAVAMADTNRLGSFQKIIYSRPLLEETIRKLGIDRSLKNDLEMERTVINLRKSIHLLGLASDSF
ncbi:MAG: Wzz/FepE/Etk N-terminal domain-containing protein, partial [Deltaproteobacteria bacterium]